jgi:hypothetical protein
VVLVVAMTLAGETLRSQSGETVQQQRSRHQLPLRVLLGVTHLPMSAAAVTGALTAAAASVAAALTESAGPRLALLPASARPGTAVTTLAAATQAAVVAGLMLEAHSTTSRTVVAVAALLALPRGELAVAAAEATVSLTGGSSCGRDTKRGIAVVAVVLLLAVSSKSALVVTGELYRLYCSSRVTL